jgi:fucose 4-O-acetylase-like acetyltransferase
MPRAVQWRDPGNDPAADRVPGDRAGARSGVGPQPVRGSAAGRRDQHGGRGHWLLTDITYKGGTLSGLDALDYVSWGQWVTLVFQVMPVFFLVGGYVNARSWAAHRQQGERWIDWVRERAMRLLWPTAVYVAVAVAAVAVAKMAGVSTAELAQASWLVALQLWFLPVYLLLIVLTPVMFAAHWRWGLAVPAVMAAAAAAVDAGVIGAHLPLIGYANYLLVWGSMHQWGFAWRDGTLTRARWRPYALAAGGAAALAGLLTWGPFPVDMIGAGERIGNTTPPSIALLAFAAAQTGLVLAAGPAVSRWLARPRRWRAVTRLNGTVMTVYLWHMVPAVIVAAVLYPIAVMPQPAIGSAQWWLTRPAWLGACALILVPLVLAVVRAERPMLRLPAGLGTPCRWSGMILLAGIAAAMTGLARLAIAGFAPDGNLPALALAALGCGVIGTLFAGRPPPTDVAGLSVADLGPPRPEQGRWADLSGPGHSWRDATEHSFSCHQAAILTDQQDAPNGGYLRPGQVQHRSHSVSSMRRPCQSGPGHSGAYSRRLSQHQRSAEGAVPFTGVARC